MSKSKIALAFLFISFSTLFASSTEQLAHDGEVAFYHQNYIEARKALVPAAQQGNLQSLYFLGIMSLKGYGTPIDYKEAVRIFKIGAQKNHADSQVALGVLMIEGIGLPQNHLQASRLFKQAAKNGNSDAQLILGWLYKNGVGVNVNNTIAYALWNYVAAQGSEWARVSRDQMYYELTEAELYRGQELSSNLPKLWKVVANNTANREKYPFKRRS
ncbi:tetratricopeptide repeat protein [Sulfuricurvum sp.]|uniref:tetratricopeptide repeat protein n=1 Tax=Sulfuricurvum sp. TaxID=2025608 RepID=UPI002E3755EF|nr:tetratricopeptide repeat protein [Sulfuricurvum sp.]HEX5329685.1 tetratricopeptide repeat protein [Sulfuricurvum sp.]